MANVLLIEDDQRIRSALARVLAERGHDIRSESSGMAGVQSAVTDDLDVVVLDLGLPDIDGTEVLRMIRSVSAVPIIVATARADQAEIVRILDHGADDYVMKPFSGEHLEARIRALLRRTGGADEPQVIEVGAW